MPGNTGEPRRNKGSRKEDTGSYPVLVVPGWGAPRFHTNWIARRLEAEGFSVMKLVFPRMGVGDMKHSAGLLSRRVDEVLEYVEAGKVNLIGYSLGGLIARIYLQEFGGYRKLGRSVFVGAPQDGVYTGYPAFFTKAGRQVSSGSSFMRELNDAGPCGCGERRCLSIYLSKDGIILPSRSAHLPCGYNLELAWPVFHWGIVFNEKVINTAADFLKGSVPGGAAPGGKS